MTEVRLRVAYRLIEFGYRIAPDAFLPRPYEGVHRLACELRGHFCGLYPELEYYARNLVYGYKLHVLRDNPPDYTLRSLAKLKPRIR